MLFAALGRSSDLETSPISGGQWLPWSPSGVSVAITRKTCATNALRSSPEFRRANVSPLTANPSAKRSSSGGHTRRATAIVRATEPVDLGLVPENEGMLSAASTSPPEAQPGRIARRGGGTRSSNGYTHPFISPLSHCRPPAGLPPLPRRPNGLNEPSDPAAGFRATEHT